MNSLIKNELNKIFHKKAIYIVLIITLGFTILNCVLEKVFSNDELFMSYDKESLKETLSTLDKNSPVDRDSYITLSAELEMIELSERYDKDSWQKYIVLRDAQSLIESTMKFAGTEDYEYAKEKYDDFIEKLNNNNWRAFAESELEIIEFQMENQLDENDSYLSGLNDQKQALEWRLEKDIPYGNNSRSQIIDNWLNDKSMYRDIQEQEKTQKLTYAQSQQKQQLEANIKLYEYAIENNLDSKFEASEINSQTAIASIADTRLVETHFTYSMFIVISAVIIAGTIVSEESNKGTIKLLLVRPYKRTKILAAKFIACLITLLFTLVVTVIFQAIVGGFTYGFGNYLGHIIIYNFGTGKVETINAFVYLILTSLAILPEIILLQTLSFALSTIFNNSPIAIAIPLLGTTVSEIINQLFLIYKKAGFLKYFVTPNWDFTHYLFGRLPKYEGLTVMFSIMICLIYFVIMLLAAGQVFRKRDIKNV